MHFYRFKILDRYIIAEILRPFLVSLAFFATLSISMALRDTLGNLIIKEIPLGTILAFFVDVTIEKFSIALPVVTLLAVLLAVGRLSGDLELDAMRSFGMSYGRIYANFLVVGLFFCILTALLIFFLGPLRARSRIGLTKWLSAYHSLSFVKPGRFFNRQVWGGNHFDIYAAKRDGRFLKNIYIHRWNIDRSKESTEITIRGKKEAVGRSKTMQIFYARKGELIARPLTAPKEGAGLRNHKEARQQSKLPALLRGRDLKDLTFVSLLPEIEMSGRQWQRYIRLEEGFTLELNPDQKLLQTTHFRQGLMDYALAPPPRSRYFAISPHILTLPELLDIYYKTESGGLVIDPLAMATGAQPRPQNYAELPRISLLPVLKQRADEISKLSPEKIQAKFGLFIPTDKDSPEKRKAHLDHVEKLSLKLLDIREQFIFWAHKRTATALSVLIFVFIAFPLGITVKRSGKGIGFSLALIVYVVYSIMNTAATLNFEKGRLPPVLAAWLPELILFVIGILVLTKHRAASGLLTSLRGLAGRGSPSQRGSK